MSTQQVTLAPAVPGTVRPPLVRPNDGRIVAGIAAGLSAHLGIPVRTVRIGLALTTMVGGFGLILYIWLWALVPSEDRYLETHPSRPDPHPVRNPIGTTSGPVVTTVPPGPPGAPGAPGPPGAPVAPGRPAPPRGRATSTRIGDVIVGGLLLAGGLVVLGAQIGWQVPLGAVLPLIVVAGGAALVYTQLDEVQGSRAAGRPSGRVTALRVVCGMVLVLGGVLLAVIGSTDVAYAGRVLAAVAAMLGGAIVVLAPWGVRFWRDLDSERTARVRESERADIAAHLHDSVLQTLALIQRNSSDSAQVTRLARAQERDLRSWLYGRGRDGFGSDAGPDAPVRFERAVRAVAEAVEDLHGVAVDVVVVGDRELDPRSQALLAALREATVNAVRHAGGPVTVYAESGPDGVEAFVRDRGPGFDLGSVPQDRHGVKESIIARMHRHGGSAEVRSVPGEGTEVRLVMPDRDVPEQDEVHRTRPDSDPASADDVPDPAQNDDQEVTG